MKRRTKILSLVAALILGQLLFVSPASADVSHYIKSPTTGRCLLGGELTSHGTGWVGTWPCHASWWLVWQWSGSMSHIHWTEIRGVASRSNLDSNTGGDVYMHPRNGEFNQNWGVHAPRVSELPQIINLETQLCLTEVSPSVVKTRRCDLSDPKQRWRFVSHPAQ